MQSLRLILNQAVLILLLLHHQLMVSLTVSPSFITIQNPMSRLICGFDVTKTYSNSTLLIRMILGRSACCFESWVLMN
ncbi:unnamed protein product [Schistosoma bovis]|nr:unnamed protein product [Schistosoma bovis]